jgi:hypothetical protein
MRLTRSIILLMVLVGLILVGLALATTLSGTSAGHRAGNRKARSPIRLAVGYTGVDYVIPASTFTGCQEWTWLQAGCYTNTSLTSSHISPQQLFGADLAFIRIKGLGTFQRVWISLDQLMSWNSTSGYAGYNSQALANVDDMLHQAAANGIKVDLVLFTNAGDGYANDFHREALDGNHPRIRASYLQALHDFVANVAADPTDAATIAVMDLQNEAYNQLESYLSTPSTLGQWNYALPSWPTSTQCYVIGNTVCMGSSAGHGCVSNSGAVDTTCVDVNIIEPWLKDMYGTAKAAGPSLNFTVSDTGRLLTTSTASYSSQASWVSMYPVDVYDIHLYNNTPWNYASRWATGRSLPKPWFAGEAGCSSGNTACTYNSTTASAVDHWWLANMAGDGARAVLIEDRHTAWTYTWTTSGEVQRLTRTGQEIAHVMLRLSRADARRQERRPARRPPPGATP